MDMKNCSKGMRRAMIRLVIKEAFLSVAIVLPAIFIAVGWACSWCSLVRLGLIANMVGVVITFFYGSPITGVYDDGEYSIALEGGTTIDEKSKLSVAENERLCKMQKIIHTVHAVMGFVYLLVGFAVQWVGAK